MFVTTTKKNIKMKNLGFIFIKIIILSLLRSLQQINPNQYQRHMSLHDEYLVKAM